jgi:uncharacterized protein YgiM (DUF1202 family)
MLNKQQKLCVTRLVLALAGAFLFTTTGSKATPTLEPRHQISDRLEDSATSQARYRVVNNVYLNVRDGGSPDYDIIAVIPAGATGVRIDDCVGGWCHVTWRAVSGWVNARFLRLENGPALPRWLRSTRR